jgi:hypothetical protein
VLVYADTSVYGGCFDAEFERASRQFFADAAAGRFRLVTSFLVLEELERAPRYVQDLARQHEQSALVLDVTDDAILLRSRYLEAGVLDSKWAADALHVALAVVSDCDLLVSWNFAHIVHRKRMPLYNAVNVLSGYHELEIRSPAEVIEYGE